MNAGRHSCDVRRGSWRGSFIALAVGTSALLLQGCGNAGNAVLQAAARVVTATTTGCPETKFTNSPVLGEPYSGTISATPDGKGAIVTCDNDLEYTGPALVCQSRWTNVLTSKIQEFSFVTEPPKTAIPCTTPEMMVTPYLTCTRPRYNPEAGSR
eukprot:TRINITY_DN11242_c0_g1_i1.p1 TRINITY_DN11242_c0_g1~~TRINITY_DN11242_c0_g1_i1.p1  ORF type:complete len:155 (+),score=9.93 TRINITY_DN11242_c0_g1_i1:70-534(+)